ncbi:hypothetical protein [Pectinatus frisingensis]|uniref:hypothetical protein n=1 Tax=Pectinatus frisingensis TaxID=865 RepID=UPI001E5E6AAD|nr:hypothetical protein [Pectinatus frisingensis]
MLFSIAVELTTLARILSSNIKGRIGTSNVYRSYITFLCSASKVSMTVKFVVWLSTSSLQTENESKVEDSTHTGIVLFTQSIMKIISVYISKTLIMLSPSFNKSFFFIND